MSTSRLETFAENLDSLGDDKCAHAGILATQWRNRYPSPESRAAPSG